MSVNLITMVKGRHNRAEAAKVQERIVERLGSVPFNKKAKPPARIRDVIPPLNELYNPDWEYVNAHYGEWVERWNREIVSR